MKLIVKDTKLQETSEILLRHFENLPETEIVIYPEYSETPGIQILKYGNNVKICYHEEVQYYLPGARYRTWAERGLLLFADRIYRPSGGHV